MMPSRLICRLLVDRLEQTDNRYARYGYLKFLKQEARTKGLKGRTGYQMAVKEICE